MPIVRVFVGGEFAVEVQVRKKTNLLDVLRENGIDIEANCGGKGICGKCKVKVKKGQEPYLEGVSPEEEKHLKKEEILKGVRLACEVEACDDLDVFLEKSSENVNILSHFVMNDLNFEDNIIVKKVVLEKPTLDNQKSFEIRLKEALGSNTLGFSVKALQKLAKIKDSEMYAVVYKDAIIDIKSSCLAYGLAVDVGTTTVVCYLVDLIQKKILDFYSFTNPQKKFGSDVISRIDFVKEREEGLLVLQSEILKAVNKAIQVLTDKNSISKDDIYRVVFVGNPTMLHLLLGVDPQTIATSPFVPVFTEGICAAPNELGLEINPAGTVSVLNCISAYVGADIVAGILSTKMHKSSGISLLLDLGTNGEMVLGGSNLLLACSTAAGPAFEGVNISCGMGALKGAIDSVRIENGKVGFTTIGAVEPTGICGSGIVDAIACMLREGIIDLTGRFCAHTGIYSSYIREVNGRKAFFLAESVFITQKDIREVQLAKAAILAGIKTMLRNAQITEDDIEKVYLAGGFGNYINPRSAVEVGIIPAKMADKIIPVGNSAGAGAVMVLLDRTAEVEAYEIAKKVRYIELSSSQEFTQFFVDSMMFEKPYQEGE